MELELPALGVARQPHRVAWAQGPLRRRVLVVILIRIGIYVRLRLRWRIEIRRERSDTQRAVRLDLGDTGPGAGRLRHELPIRRVVRAEVRSEGHAEGLRLQRELGVNETIGRGLVGVRTLLRRRAFRHERRQHRGKAEREEAMAHAEMHGEKRRAGPWPRPTRSQSASHSPRGR